MFQTMYLWTVPFSILLFASHWLPLHRACLWAAIIVLCLQQPVCAPGSMKYLPTCFPGDSFFAALTVRCLCSTSSCVSSCGCCMSCTKFIKVLNEDYFTICLFVLFMHCIEDWFDVLQNLDFQNSRMSSFLWKPPSRPIISQGQAPGGAFVCYLTQVLYSIPVLCFHELPSHTLSSQKEIIRNDNYSNSSHKCFLSFKWTCWGCLFHCYQPTLQLEKHLNQ